MNHRLPFVALSAALVAAGCQATPSLPVAELAIGQTDDAATHHVLADTKTSFSTNVTTVAGTGKAGFMEGPAAAAKFNGPHGLTVDAAGNLYVADTFNMGVRKISPAGVVLTYGFPMALGKLVLPRAVAMMPDGRLAVLENQKNRVQFLDAAGNVTPFVGGRVESIAKGFLPGTYGYADGQGEYARFQSMYDFCLDGAGNMYITDRNRIRKVSPSGAVTTIAGIEKVGHVDGQGSIARFNTVKGICCDKATGVLYVVDSGNDRIRKITPTPTDPNRVMVEDYVGQSPGYQDSTGANACFEDPTDVAIDSLGNLYVTDSGNHCIRKVLPNRDVITLAGSRTEGATDGPGGTALFSAPNQIAVDAANNVYVTDLKNHKIRKIEQL